MRIVTKTGLGRILRALAVVTAFALILVGNGAASQAAQVAAPVEAGASGPETSRNRPAPTSPAATSRAPTSSMEETYAAREAKSQTLENFRGGDVVIIGSGGVILVLLIILILVIA